MSTRGGGSRFAVVNCGYSESSFLQHHVLNGCSAKYLLAIVNKVMDNFGDNILIGYDISCGFSTTANNSPQLGEKVRAKHCKFGVNSFHGHAHNRGCQLCWHPLYRKGTSLEDFEGCEHIFSESNKVAACTRHASTFHRRQSILRHFMQWNDDKVGESSGLLLSLKNTE